MNMKKYACAYFIGPKQDISHIYLERNHIASSLDIPSVNVKWFYHWCPVSSKLTKEDSDYFIKAVIESFYEQISSDELFFDNLDIAERDKNSDTFIIYLEIYASLSSEISNKLIKDFTHKYEHGNIQVVPITFTSE